MPVPYCTAGIMLATECWHYRAVAWDWDSLLTEIRGLDSLLTKGRDWDSLLTEIRDLYTLLIVIRKLDIILTEFKDVENLLIYSGDLIFI